MAADKGWLLVGWVVGLIELVLLCWTCGLVVLIVALIGGSWLGVPLFIWFALAFAALGVITRPDSFRRRATSLGRVLSWLGVPLRLIGTMLALISIALFALAMMYNPPRPTAGEEAVVIGWLGASTLELARWKIETVLNRDA